MRRQEARRQMARDREREEEEGICQGCKIVSNKNHKLLHACFYKNILY